jgi:BirA family transcriptional regulator, biotin operon repressor / biotin---[acetyl-CoA-carboxylase] ligase
MVEKPPGFNPSPLTAHQAGEGGFPHLHVSTISSTNAELLDRAQAGEAGPLWLTAGQQIAGRGRSGRNWSSPPGNLYASLLLTDPCPMRDAPGLGFVAGVALIRAIAKAAPLLRTIGLKWPNDVIANGGKIAGILPEARMVEGRLAVVIGLGVNCAFHPADTPYPATNLAAEGAPLSPDALFAVLSPAMTAALKIFDQGLGLAAILAIWRQHAFGLGGPIVVRPPSGEISGLFEDIAEDGALLLRKGASQVRISAGDVYFGASAALGAGEKHTIG